MLLYDSSERIVWSDFYNTIINFTAICKSKLGVCNVTLTLFTKFKIGFNMHKAYTNIKFFKMSKEIYIINFTFN